MSAFTTFEDSYNHLQDLHRTQNYLAALDLANQMFDGYPEHRSLLYYWRMTMSARLGKTEQFLALLDSSLQEGIWFGETLLRKSPSFQDLQENPAFEQRVAYNLELQKYDSSENYPMLTLRPMGRCQQGGNPCPMLLGLHANSSTARASVEFWSPAASSGYLVAIPQSSQAMWKGAFIWDDLEIALNDIQKHYQRLLDHYAINPNETILAGHSMGGEVAIWLGLTQKIAVQGFLAIGPGGPLVDDPDSWRPLIEENPFPDLRGHIIVGEKDHTVSLDNITRLVEMLEDAGIDCELEIVPGANHDFSPAYVPALKRALEFIA